MTHRERALAAYSFQATDVPCLDLMEGQVWEAVRPAFAAQSLTDDEAIQTALGSDFRWTIFRTDFSGAGSTAQGATFSDDLAHRPLSRVKTPSQIKDIMAYDASQVPVPDFAQLRRQYPDHALICCPGWMAFFSGMCNDFGMVRAMELMGEDSDMVAEYVRLKGEYGLAVIRRCLREGAAEHCDFLWLGDDFSGETSMLLSPAMWRAYFKEALGKQVAEARDAGLKVMYHSCGDVAAIYEDWIEIGINAHVGVQTSCPDMSPEQLAATIGGRLVIHGGVDAQSTLVAGSEEEVIAQTKRNIRAFAGCGGYVVSNSHYGMPDVGGEKLIAMSKGAGRWSG